MRGALAKSKRELLCEHFQQTARFRENQGPFGTELSHDATRTNAPTYGGDQKSPAQRICWISHIDPGLRQTHPNHRPPRRGNHVTSTTLPVFLRDSI